LFKGARHPNAVYHLCQAIEKVLKAAQVELTNELPKKIHDLESLARQTKLDFSQADWQSLKELAQHYRRVRYPDYQRALYSTKAKVQPIINQGKELYLWIFAQLKNH
jgi:HEPN domain-containing protein